MTLQLGGAVKKSRVDQLEIQSQRPWIEKYRPQTLDEVQSQEEAVNALRKCLAGGANVPHLLFHGPPGTGKTTTILAVAHQLFGPDHFKNRVKELNASDDRGISVVREKVKIFAQGSVASSAVLASKPQSDGKVYPVPAFKLLVLDEADALTSDAQAALRRMMEDFSEVTRFCILCNYVSRIIDPITSRCAKFRFKPLGLVAISQRLRHIATCEGITVSDATLSHLDVVAQGDMRRAIMTLQAAAKAKGVDLTKENFREIAGWLSDDAVNEFMAVLCSRDLARITALITHLVAQGYSAMTLLTQLQRCIVDPSCPLRDHERGAIAMKLCETEKRLLDRGDDFIQLLDVGAAFTALKRL